MMSSRRKSNTPCMVLPTDVVEQEEVEGRIERTMEEDMEVEGKTKEGAEEGPTAEELDQAVVVVPTPPDTDEPGPPPVEDSEVLCPSLRRSVANAPEDPGSDKPTLPQQCETAEEGGGAAAADPVSVTAISLSKTPIMRMKSKSEPKRIAVSLKSADEAAEGFEGGGGGGGGGGGEGEVGGEQEPIEAPLGPMTPVEMLLHDSMKLGGGGLLVSPPSSEQQRKSSVLNPAVLPASLAQVLSAFQAQQNAAAAAQPQLLIPLSSIPSYSAAMDTNPLLGGTYKKFPYPSMAEISCLAAQTQFTEEQIKVWFSAQRLKHGVSWTPEEVEEARRKQFNGTVHTVPQTITVIPAHQLSAAANGLQSILQTCQIVGQPGLVFTQENSALSADTFSMRPKKSKEQLAELKASYLKNHFVSDAEISRLMKLTNLTKGEIKKWFSDTRYNQRNSKNSHVIVFHDGGSGRGNGGCSSNANATIIIDSSDETPTSPHPPRTPPVREKEARPKTWNPFPDFTLQKFKEKTPEQLVVLEESFEKNTTPSDEELSRMRTETKLTRREIDAWFTERRKMPNVSTSSPDSNEGGKWETDEARAGEGGGTGGLSSSPSASSSRRGSQTPPGGRSKQVPTTSSASRDMKDKSKKTPEQLHVLKSAFVRTQWPTPDEYDQLAEESGLPRSYIVSWFGDSRYSWKNGNLKWFFQYQSGNVEGLNGGGGNKTAGGSGGGNNNNNRKRRGRNRGWGRSRTRKHLRRSASSEVDGPLPPKKSKSGREILKEYYLRHRFLNEQDLDELVTKTNMSYEQVREWFAEVHRRVDTGLDPFHEPAAGRTEGEDAGEAQGETAMATDEQTSIGMGNEDEDEDEEEEDIGDDSDDSEVWEPSRSVRKSLSVSED
ncbi:zinc fingers and homeoboxes protein 1 isoform X2 [Genypterus blacodes]|uniref:zinc fingers and homeoboxes protein 1 isoform X2 n=1 Tax=Genypterus blacodes TaxID=154954 RepID=UPI003F76C898